MRVLALLQFGVVAFVGVQRSHASPGFLRAAVRAHKVSELLPAARSVASSLQPKASEAMTSLTGAVKQNLASKAAAAYQQVASMAAGSPQLVQGGIVQRALGREIGSTSPKILTGHVAERLSAALKSRVSGMQAHGDKRVLFNEPATNSASQGFGIMQAVRTMGLTGRT